MTNHDWDDPQFSFRAKAKRARRRELEALRDPGHLQEWFKAQGWPDYSEVQGNGAFSQLMRSWRHSCHSACCVIDAYEKRHRNRKQRQEAKVELRKRHVSTVLD